MKVLKEVHSSISNHEKKEVGKFYSRVTESIQSNRLIINNNHRHYQ